MLPRLKKRSVPVALIFMIFIIAFSSSVSAQQTKQVSLKIKELQEQRLNVLKDAYLAMHRLSLNTTEPGEVVRLEMAELFAAMRGNAATRVERIEVSKAEVEEAELWLQRAAARREGASGTLTQERMYLAYRFKAQITLEEVSEGEKDSPQIQGLRGEQVQALADAFEAMQRENTATRPFTDEAVLEVTTKFFSMRRDLADSKEERLKILEDEEKEAQKLFEHAKEKNAARRGTGLSVLRFQVYLLDVQILLNEVKEQNQTSPDFKKLQTERLELLEKAFSTTKTFYRSARCEQDTVINIMAKLFAVQRESAPTREERINAIQEQVKEAKELMEFAQSRVDAARGTVHSVLRFQLDLLDAQIALENEKESE